MAVSTGLSVLQMNTTGVSNKTSAPVEKVCKEAGSERASKTRTIDRAASDSNDYFMINGVETGQELADWLVAARDKESLRRKKAGRRGVRKDCNVGASWVVYPAKRDAGYWSISEQQRFARASQKVVCEILQLSSCGFSIHRDEGSWHVHGFGYDPEYQLSKKIDPRALQRLHKEFPLRMKKEYGFDVQLHGLDAENEEVRERLTPEASGLPANIRSVLIDNLKLLDAEKEHNRYLSHSLGGRTKAVNDLKQQVEAQKQEQERTQERLEEQQRELQRQQQLLAAGQQQHSAQVKALEAEKAEVREQKSELSAEKQAVAAQKQQVEAQKKQQTLADTRAAQERQQLMRKAQDYAADQRKQADAYADTVTENADRYAEQQKKDAISKWGDPWSVALSFIRKIAAYLHSTGDEQWSITLNGVADFFGYPSNRGAVDDFEKQQLQEQKRERTPETADTADYKNNFDAKFDEMSRDVAAEQRKRSGYENDEWWTH